MSFPLHVPPSVIRPRMGLHVPPPPPYPAPTQSGIAAISVYSAIKNPKISESVSVERNVAAATNTISESVEVAVS